MSRAHADLGTEQSTAPYAEALHSYAAKDWLRLNVPGHSAAAHRFPGLTDLLGTAPLLLDVPPLLENLDLGPDNPMDRALRLAAEAWGARRTWFLTNGASQGNRIATLATRSLGDRIAVQRSVHSSVIDGLVLSGLEAAFVQPAIDTALGIAHGITPKALAETLTAHPDAVAAYVVSPSYFGAVANVRALADTAHAAGIPLIVDEAWGAHFGFHPGLPGNALSHGADLVISSTHKLAGSLTQSAMLHLAYGPHADVLEPFIERAFRLTQSTSTNSLLLASLDITRRTLTTNADTIARSLDAADRIRDAVRAHGRFAVVSDGFHLFDDIVASDPLRIPIDTACGGIRGHQARRQLMNDHQILVEVATGSAIVAVVGAGSAPDPRRFTDALHALPADTVTHAQMPIRLPRAGSVRMTARDAFLSPAETVPAHQAVGRVSADALAAYPPGVPNVLPGEVITAELVNFFQRIAAAPTGHVRGAVDPAVTTLRVVVTNPEPR